MKEPRSSLFRRDERGRTPLFEAAERGDYPAVWDMIFSLTGTGFYPQRLSLIEIEDHDGRTALDAAEAHGHDAIAQLLRVERERMDRYE